MNLDMFKGIIEKLIDFVIAIVKAEFPELADVLGGAEEKEEITTF